MNPERYKQIDQVFQRALSQPPGRLDSFLKEACAGDTDLRSEVESLLECDQKARGFMNSPAPGVTGENHASDPYRDYAGRSLLHYRIVEKIGEGGMGVVYRALDAHLDRSVALKVLPPEAMTDPERKRRFIQEAKAASALNHPNIITIYDISQAEGIDFIAMEYVAGRTLAQLIEDKDLPLQEALNCAIQIVDALATAHESAIVHRDLKPGNIMVTGKGQVKVLDFGLAKLAHPSHGNVLGLTKSSETPTKSSTVVGTVAYMSPEQAEGKAVDARSDIFSFGAVLYEMVTGRQAFKGDSNISTLAAVLHEDPKPISGMAGDVPQELERIINKSLEKDLDIRYQHASDLCADLKRLKGDSESGKSATHPEPAFRVAHRWRPGYWIATTLVLLASALGTTWWVTRSKDATIPTQLRRLTWDTGLTTDPALSPDGRWLAYASDRSGEGNLDIWVQQLAGGEARGEPIRLTRDPADDSEPNFSPDGSQITFTSARDGGGIYLISTTGGQERLLFKEGHRPRFSPDGRSLAYWVGSSLWQLDPKSFILPLSGGVARQVQPTFRGVAFPTWSPDGSHLLFYGWKKPELGTDMGEDAEWWVTPAEGGTALQTGIREFPGQELPALPEWIVQEAIIFPRRRQDSTDIWQVPISPKTFMVDGTPERLTAGTGLQIDPAFASGYLAFAGLTLSGNIYALPIDHIQGKAQGEIRRLTQDTTMNGRPSVSADGTKLVYTSERSGSASGWIRDLKSGRVARLLTESREHRGVSLPKIAGDGSRVAYNVLSESRKQLFVADTDDLVARLLCEDCGAPSAWFPDASKLLVYFLPGNRKRLEAIDINSGERTLVAQYAHDLVQPHVSPDGHWMSLCTSVSAPRTPVKVMAVPLRNGVAAREEEWVTVTDGFGIDLDANWSPGGNVLYFFSDRDGFRCIWGQRLEPSSKKPLGPAFAVYHSHDPSRSIRNIVPGYLCMSVSSDQIVFPMGELTGNIWITEFRQK